jgi:hypothetical protein
MQSQKFLESAIKLTGEYADNHLSKSEPKPKYGVHVVSYEYVLGCNKAMLTTDLPDGMYYEATFNDVKQEMYFDAYKKFENICIQAEDL